MPGEGLGSERAEAQAPVLSAPDLNPAGGRAVSGLALIPTVVSVMPAFTWQSKYCLNMN